VRIVSIPFKAYEVDYLVRAAKFISEVPPMQDTEYDTFEAKWEQESRSILESKATFAVPSDALPMLEDRLTTIH